METKEDTLKEVPTSTPEQPAESKPDAVVAPEPPKPSEDVLSRAEELIKINTQKHDLEIQADQLKNSLMPYVKINPIKTPQGQIFYVVGSTSKYLSKDKLKQMMIEQLRISEQLADQILSMGSLDKVLNPYIKVVTT